MLPVVALTFTFTFAVLAPPPVSVEARAGGEAYRGAVVQRFLEGGRVLVSSSDPNASHVTIRVLRQSVLVEASRGTAVVSAEIDRSDDAVDRLEVVHRAVDAVRELEGADASDRLDPRPVAALHFVGYEPAPGDVAAASSALLDAGFDVVGADAVAHPDWVVCVWRRDEGFVAARRDAPPCPAAPPLSEPTTVGAGVKVEAEAQAADRLAALADEVDDTPIPAEAHRPAPPPRAPPSTGPAPWVVARADAGALFRVTEVDGTVGFGLGAGRGYWGGAARVELVPFILRSSRVRTLDTIIGVGPSVGGSLSPRVRLRGFILGGVLVHRFRWEAEPPQTRVDGQGSFALALDLALGRGVGLHFLPTFGVTSRSRSHREGDAIAWQRSALRIGLAVGLHVRHEGRKGAR